MRWPSLILPALKVRPSTAPYKVRVRSVEHLMGHHRVDPDVARIAGLGANGMH